MAEIEATPSLEDMLLTGDMDGFIKAQIGEEADEPQAPALAEEAPAAPVAEPPAAEVPAPEPRTSWREQVIPEDDPDVDGFFKGKPVGEIYKSQRHATLKIQEQGERLKKLEAQLAAREALADVAKQLQRPESAPEAAVDPFVARGINLQEDAVLRPEKVMEAMRDISREESERIADEKIGKVLQQRDQVQYQQTVINAIEAARNELHIPGEDFSHDGYVLLEVAKQIDPRLATNPKFYVNYLQERAQRAARYGQSASPAAPAAAPPPPPPASPASAANPPGAKRPASAPPVANEGNFALDARQRAAMEEGFESLGHLKNDPEVRKLFEQNYVARVQRRRE